MLWAALIGTSQAAPDGHGHSHGTASGHSHKDHAHGSDGHHGVSLKLDSVGQAWSASQDAIKAITVALESNQLATIPVEESKLAISLKYLQKNSSMVTGDKAKRLESALKQALALGGQLHGAAENNNSTKAADELKKLTGAMKLIEIQYPEGALKPTPAS